MSAHRLSPTTQKPYGIGTSPASAASQWSTSFGTSPPLCCCAKGSIWSASAGAAGVYGPPHDDADEKPEDTYYVSVGEMMPDAMASAGDIMSGASRAGTLSTGRRSVFAHEHMYW